MSAGGDPRNANVWSEGDVLIAPLGSDIPEDGSAFDLDQWSYVGYLNGEDGFTETIEVETNDHFAWGGHLLATTRSNFKLTRTFTAFEDNETVMDLVYPGHDVSFGSDGTGGLGPGAYEGILNVPDLQAEFMIAFETRTGSQLKRFVSAYRAQVDERGDKEETEGELAARELTIAIYPGETDSETGDSPLVYVYKGPDNRSSS